LGETGKGVKTENKVKLLSSQGAFLEEMKNFVTINIKRYRRIQARQGRPKSHKLDILRFQPHNTLIII
jgi:hypothetical protein